MTARLLPNLLVAIALASLASCSPKEEPSAASSTDTDPTPAASNAPASTPAEEVARTQDELGAGREIAAPEPTPNAPSEAELRARERELARRERDVRAREARAAAAAPVPRPRVEEPAPAREEIDPSAPTPEESDEYAEEGAPGQEPGEDSGVDENDEAPLETERTPAATVPSGEHLAVELIGDLSSAESRAGDTFRVRVARDVRADGEVAIPAGSEVQGLVSEAVGAGEKRGQPAKLTLKFTDLILPSGEAVPIRATLEQIGESHPGKKAATVGGGAAAGAVLGRVLAGKGSRGTGTVIGALVGALAGAAIASHSAATEEISIPAGTLFDLRLDESVEIGGGR